MILAHARLHYESTGAPVRRRSKRSSKVPLIKLMGLVAIVKVVELIDCRTSLFESSGPFPRAAFATFHCFLIGVDTGAFSAASRASVSSYASCNDSPPITLAYLCPSLFRRFTAVARA